MKLVIGWSVAVGLMWGLVLGALYAVEATLSEPQPELQRAILHFIDIGKNLGSFVSPILQLGLILYILVSVAERFGIKFENIRSSNIDISGNIQSVIALIVVSAFAVAALTSVGQVGALKDICLVVVGFYFGTRRRQADTQDDAVLAGVAGGGIVAGAVTQASTSDTPLKPSEAGPRSSS